MEQLIQLKNELQTYSTFELTYGIFLFLDENRNATNIEKRYEIFEAYIVNFKNFNKDNKEFLLSVYNKYVEFCNNMDFSIRSWMTKGFFNKIIKCYPTMSSKQYYIDRGYDIVYATHQAKLFNSHKYVPSENKWISFIKTFDISKRKQIDKSRVNIQKRFTGTVDYELIKQQRLNTFIGNQHFTNSELQNILFDCNGMILTNPVSFDFFKNEIFNNFKDFNRDNINYIKFLYQIYVEKLKDKKFCLQPNYCRFSIFFNLPSNKTQLSIQYWINMGYTEDVAKLKISEIQSNRALSWDKAVSLYGNDADKRMQQYKDKIYDTRQRHKQEDTTGTYGVMYSKTIDPSTGTYYTGDALIQKRRTACCIAYDKARQKHIQNLKEHKTFTCFQKEWWIAKGFSEKDAIKKVIDIMPKSNIEWFIEKYGEKNGLIKYQKRIEKYKQTMDNKSDEEKYQILLKKVKVPHRVSKSSTIFFETVFQQLYELYGIQISEMGHIFYGDNEYHIYDAEYKNIYFYDLCIKQYNIIIEYNGHLFHPHKIPYDQLNNWKSLFYQIDGKEQLEKDKRKEQIAIEKGYHYLVIWDDEPFSKNCEKTVEFIYDIIKNEN